MAGWVNRENRVPHYQRLFQAHGDPHIRQWAKTPRSPYILYPYWIVLGGTFGCSLWMMGRQVLGHKTWWGEG